MINQMNLINNYITGWLGVNQSFRPKGEIFCSQVGDWVILLAPAEVTITFERERYL